MSQTTTLFPGAMGPDGFISCFDHLMDEQQIRRKIILKGGPGVGKSTFMRRVHAALCKNGEEATLYVCSGDPDSLDAVAIAHAGLLILDGTAPHVIDPAIPGARDSIVNLGDCLDEAALRKRIAPIRAIMRDHAAMGRRARACMQAACALRRDNAALIAAAVDGEKRAKMTRALQHAVLDSGAPGQNTPHVRRVITDAVTLKGEMSLIAENPQPRVIRAIGHWAMDMTDVLREVSLAARAAGYAVWEHLCPAVPGWLLHLTIPALGVLITTGDQLPSEQTFDFSACMAQGALLRCESALEQGRAGVMLHTGRAAAAMKEAKQLHDELEAFYVPNMDFAAWEKKLDATLASLN